MYCNDFKLYTMDYSTSISLLRNDSKNVPNDSKNVPWPLMGVCEVRFGWKSVGTLLETYWAVSNRFWKYLRKFLKFRFWPLRFSFSAPSVGKILRRMKELSFNYIKSVSEAFYALKIVKTNDSKNVPKMFQKCSMIPKWFQIWGIMYTTSTNRWILEMERMSETTFIVQRTPHAFTSKLYYVRVMSRLSMSTTID